MNCELPTYRQGNTEPRTRVAPPRPPPISRLTCLTTLSENSRASASSFSPMPDRRGPPGLTEVHTHTVSALDSEDHSGCSSGAIASHYACTAKAPLSRGTRVAVLASLVDHIRRAARSTGRQHSAARTQLAPSTARSSQPGASSRATASLSGLGVTGTRLLPHGLGNAITSDICCYLGEALQSEKADQIS